MSGIHVLEELKRIGRMILIEDLKGWETQKKNYLSKVQPLLSEKSKQLDQLFQDYLNKVGSIIRSQGFESEVEQSMVLEEKEKFKKIKQQLFGPHVIHFLVSPDFLECCIGCVRERSCSKKEYLNTGEEYHQNSESI